MSTSWILNISLLISLLFTLSCANIIAPKGGPKDEQAPRLIESASTENYQTNFTKRSFELTYDEWVQLNDVFNQVLVSPPLEFRPEVDLKKRTVIFEFNEEEVLRENATYVINFGKAIADLTEKNPAEMVFVFSTGDYIDSLKLEGTIVDAYTDEPVADVLSLAYDNFADSVFRTERPFYFGRTDKDGKFLIQNMKSDTFKITTLIDGNLNYLFDNPNEKIGFLDSTIILNDSTKHELTIRLFQEEVPLFLKNDENESYGKAQLIFNKPPTEAIINYDDFGQYVFTEIDKDTLQIWYDIPIEKQYTLKETKRDSNQVVFDSPEALEWNIYVQMDTLRDTILIKKNVKNDFATKNKITLSSSSIPNFHPKSDIALTFNHPLYFIDSTLVQVNQDTLPLSRLPNFTIDSLQQRQLNIAYSWQENANYEFLFLPGAFVDQFGLYNQDTIVYQQKVAALEDFGNVVLKFKDLADSLAYYIELQNEQTKVMEQFAIADTTNFEKNIKTLPPGKYKVLIIEDLDRNAAWTTGNYDKRRQPERIRRQDLEEVRANWDVEAEISVNFAAETKKQPSFPPKTENRDK